MAARTPAGSHPTSSEIDMASEPQRRSVSSFAGIVSRDGISGILLILLGAATLYLNRNLSFGSMTSMGPGFFPRLLSFALVLAGFWIMIRGMIAGRLDIGWEDISSAPWRGLIVVGLSILVFALILETAGMFIASALLVFGSALAARPVRWGEAIIFAIVTSAAVTAIFIGGLQVTIPLWPDFF